ncbi:MAG: alpha/beta hydrolase [Rhodobacteraceae bacterium]|nr:alpha/beta hydrolase [Paracoccaceae bacterium]
MKDFITSDGLRLDYRDEGTGQVVLCLPGLTRDLTDFDELAAALNGNVRLIRLTMRGRKGSDFDPNFQNYNIVQESRDVVEFMDFMGLEKAVIVGTSRGGFIAMILAGTMPERLSGVLLNDIGPELTKDGLQRIVDYLGITPKAQNLPDLVSALQSTMLDAFPNLPPEKWGELAMRWFDVTPDGVALNYDPTMRDAMLEQQQKPTPDLWPLFDMMAEIPLALVRGANSDLLAAEAAAEMRRRIPAMIFADVPNRGHIPFLDEPEALDALNQLLKLAK